MMKTIFIVAALLSSALAGASDIILSQGIKPAIREHIERDLSALENFKFKPADERLLSLLEVKSLNAQTATQWLEKRVKYLIEENALSDLNLLLKKTVYVEREGVKYPNAGLLPYSLDPKNQGTETPVTTNETDSNGQTKGLVMMTNISPSLYMGGKKEGKVYGVKISKGLLKKADRVIIESPRTGIIQIGEGLFMDRFLLNFDGTDSYADSIIRLGFLFHEARHSDGNGISLGFAHSPCPANHDYAGALACDESLNGSYAVSAALLKEMLNSCEDACGPREKTVLKMIILDSESRIMKTTRTGKPTEDWDATPESL